jgi:penicillin-binding protein 1A
LFLSSEKTVERKATELVYAIQLERSYSKKQILGLYLSRANFGGGAYGLEAAALRYFNKPASKLTIREAAMLAAVMKSPTNYNPATEPDKNAERTELVLAAMAETGAITPEQRAKASAATWSPWTASAASGPWWVAPTSPPPPTTAPWRPTARRARPGSPSST